MCPLDIKGVLGFPLHIDRRLGVAGPGHGEVSGRNAAVAVEGGKVAGSVGIIAGIYDRNCSPSPGGKRRAGFNGATGESLYQLIHARDRCRVLCARGRLVLGLVGVYIEIIGVHAAGMLDAGLMIRCSFQTDSTRSCAEAGEIATARNRAMATAISPAISVTIATFLEKGLMC